MDRITVEFLALEGFLMVPLYMAELLWTRRALNVDGCKQISHTNHNDLPMPGHCQWVLKMILNHMGTGHNIHVTVFGHLSSGTR